MKGVPRRRTVLPAVRGMTRNGRMTTARGTTVSHGSTGCRDAAHAGAAPLASHPTRRGADRRRGQRHAGHAHAHGWHTICVARAVRRRRHRRAVRPRQREVSDMRARLLPSGGTSLAKVAPAPTSHPAAPRGDRVSRPAAGGDKARDDKTRGDKTRGDKSGRTAAGSGDARRIKQLPRGSRSATVTDVSRRLSLH